MGTTRAGKPMAMLHAGTSLVTSAPAATIAPSPISTPGSIVEFAPNEAPFRKTGPLSSYITRIGYLSLASTEHGPRNTLSSMTVFVGMYTLLWMLTLLPMDTLPSMTVLVPRSTLSPILVFSLTITLWPVRRPWPASTSQ